MVLYINMIIKNKNLIKKLFMQLYQILKVLGFFSKGPSSNPLGGEMIFKNFI